MLISVVIPHLNQEEHLAVGLESLHQQKGLKSDYEIIVVDNGSRELPEATCARWDNVRLLQEPTPGPGPARNRGAAAAHGDLLAFVDADCVADENWLATIERAFEDPNRQVAGGDVRVSYQHVSRTLFHEPYEAIYSYRNEMHIEEGFSGTGNLATRPAVLKDVGEFAGIDVAEDRDWGQRALALGYTIDYLPDMIVTHPTRPSFADLTLKWDRHISHDYAEVDGLYGKLKWAGRAIAVGGSPVAELPEIARSPRVSGFRERLLALACLIRIRTFRARRMTGMLFARSGSADSRVWNRG